MWVIFCRRKVLLHLELIIAEAAPGLAYLLFNALMMTVWRTVLPNSDAKPQHPSNPIVRHAPMSNPI